MKKILLVVAGVLISLGLLAWATMLFLQNLKAASLLGAGAWLDFAALLFLPAGIVAGALAGWLAPPGRRLDCLLWAIGTAWLGLLAFLGLTAISDVILGAVAFYGVFAVAIGSFWEKIDDDSKNFTP